MSPKTCADLPFFCRPDHHCSVPVLRNQCACQAGKAWRAPAGVPVHGWHLGASLSVLTCVAICVWPHVYHCLSCEIAYITRGRDRICFPVFLALSTFSALSSVNTKWMNRFLFTYLLPCSPVTQDHSPFKWSHPPVVKLTAWAYILILCWYFMWVLQRGLVAVSLPAGEPLWDSHPPPPPPQQISGPEPTFPCQMFSVSAVDMSWLNRGPLWLLPLLELQRGPREKKFI